MKIKVTQKQHKFINAKEDEVLFGGAAGGGKSYAQLIDALFYAMKYKNSKQIMLRRTYPELEMSLIRQALMIYPKEIYQYMSSKKMGVFCNGSIIDFGYCDSENDVYRYQGAEFDMIRFDELTHFTQQMYLYLLSRLRGANNYPKQVKSSTNPGGVGHAWVKARFIDPAPAECVFGGENDADAHTKIFLPALVQQNSFLLDKDPNYPKRLELLPEKEKQALLFGNWDIFEGQFFDEFEVKKHVVKPFKVPPEWRVYRTLDYGLDMLACYWVAVKENGEAVVYKELYEKNLIISQAAKAIIKQNGDDDIFLTLAPPDLWNRRQETGKSVADIFLENGIILTKSGGDRVSGWLAVKEWLKPVKSEMGCLQPKLKFFDVCRNLIRTLPSLRHDDKRVNDVANTPHELTHAPDAIRCFCGYWVLPQASRKKKKGFSEWDSDMQEDFG